MKVVPLQAQLVGFTPAPHGFLSELSLFRIWSRKAEIVFVLFYYLVAPVYLHCGWGLAATKATKQKRATNILAFMAAVCGVGSSLAVETQDNCDQWDRGRLFIDSSGCVTLTFVVHWYFAYVQIDIVYVYYGVYSLILRHRQRQFNSSIHGHCTGWY